MLRDKKIKGKGSIEDKQDGKRSDESVKGRERLAKKKKRKKRKVSRGKERNIGGRSLYANQKTKGHLLFSGATENERQKAKKTENRGGNMFFSGAQWTASSFVRGSKKKADHPHLKVELREVPSTESRRRKKTAGLGRTESAPLFGGGGIQIHHSGEKKQNRKRGPSLQPNKSDTGIDHVKGRTVPIAFSEGSEEV